MIPARLFADRFDRICAGMRAFPILLAAPLLLAVPALAQTAKPPPAAKASGPREIGRFEDWTAATTPEAGQTACYAFARAQGSTPAVAGRGEVVLTVTKRHAGAETVALSAGFAYPQGATVTLQVEQAALDFYTAGRNAFARDGRAAVAALNRGRQAIIRSPGPHAATVVDTFSLKGFSRAYEAISKACPVK